MTPKIIDKETKKQQILEAAIRVFARLGLPNTKMLHIAEAAGIGKGTIYEYFRSKEDLFVAAFNVFIKESKFKIDRLIRSIDDPENKLRMYFRGWSEFMNSELIEFADIMLDMWAEGIRHGQQKIDLNTMYEEYRSQIIGILDEGIRQKRFKPMNTTIVSSVIIGTLDGLLIQWIMDKDIFSVKEAMSTLENIIINGIIIE